MFWNWIWNVSIFKQIRRGFQPASTSLFAVLKMKTRAPHSFAQVFHERETKGEISSRFFFFLGFDLRANFLIFSWLQSGPKKLNGHWLHEALAKSLHISYAVKVSSSYHLSVECFSQLIQKCIQNQQQLLFLYTLLNQMRVVKNIRRKDDRITSL